MSCGNDGLIICRVVPPNHVGITMGPVYFSINHGGCNVQETEGFFRTMEKWVPNERKIHYLGIVMWM
jgi:hypothetical protein